MKIDFVNRFKYLLLVVAGMAAFMLSIIEAAVPEGNFYVSCILSIVNIIVCYGIVSSLFFLTNSEGKFFVCSTKDVLKVVVAAVCVVIICYFFQNAVFNLAYVVSGYVPEKYQYLVENIIFEENNYSVKERMVLIISFGIITPFFEELFFRFVMLECYPATSFVLRFVMVNFCFIFIHDDINLMIFVIPLSFISSFLMHHTKCFFYPFIIHCVVNIVGIMEIPLDEIVFSPKYVIQYGEKISGITNALFNLLMLDFFLS